MEIPSYGILMKAHSSREKSEFMMQHDMKLKTLIQMPQFHSVIITFFYCLAWVIEIELILVSHSGFVLQIFL